MMGNLTRIEEYVMNERCILLLDRVDAASFNRDPE